MEWLFAKEMVRSVKRDGTISYNNLKYQLKKGTCLKKDRVTVKESIYGDVKLYD
jgi:hypothetical protein